MACFHATFWQRFLERGRVFWGFATQSGTLHCVVHSIDASAPKASTSATISPPGSEDGAAPVEYHASTVAGHDDSEEAALAALLQAPYDNGCSGAYTGGPYVPPPPSRKAGSGSGATTASGTSASAGPGTSVGSAATANGRGGSAVADVKAAVDEAALDDFEALLNEVICVEFGNPSPWLSVVSTAVRPSFAPVALVTARTTQCMRV